MVKNNSIFSGCHKLILAAVLAGFAWAHAKAYCQTDQPVLLLQQIPPNGGKITPDAGVHHIELNTSVTLTADPQPGYQFVYWLGDVSEPTSNRTTVYLDAPKIIVAIFERAEYGLEDMVEIGPGIPGRFGGARRAGARDYSRQGYSGGGAKRPSTRRASTRPPEPPLPPPEVPVPIPEPATLVLFTIGSLLAIAARKDSQGGRTLGK
jgi:hypothetical protein